MMKPAPPSDENEVLQLAAAKACSPETSFLVHDFRDHFKACPWCQEYVKQYRDEETSAISEVGWWSGRADRDIA